MGLGCKIADIQQIIHNHPQMRMKIAGIILAAGRSTRMGSTKQLLAWRDCTVLEQTVRHAQTAQLDPIIVVTGHEADKIDSLLEPYPVHMVYNPDYVTGEMLSSLQVGVRALPAGISAMLVLLADQPMVPPAIFQELCQAYERGKGELIAPVYAGKRGNPVLISQKYFEPLLGLPAGSAPRALLQQFPQDLCLLPVNTPTVLADLDDPASYQLWYGKLFG